MATYFERTKNLLIFRWIKYICKTETFKNQIQMDKNFEFFFHAGLGKTGSTYLQHKFFPKLKGIEYIQNIKYRDNGYLKVIKRSKNNRFLHSTEFDTQLEHELAKMSKEVPHAKIIVVLRQHDKWAASQYRRFVKNAKTFSFKEFLDLENDKGFWKIKDFYFYDKLKFIEEHFESKPLVLMYDEFRKSPLSFFDKIAEFTGSTYDKDKINLTPKHVSYNEKQLKVMRQYGSKLFKQDMNEAENYWLKMLQVKSKMIGTHAILYTAPLFPNKWLSNEPLITEEELKAVKDFYADDWKKCLEYAQ